MSSIPLLCTADVSAIRGVVLSISGCTSTADAVRMEGGRAVFAARGRFERQEQAPLISPDFEAGAANLEDLARFTP